MTFQNIRIGRRLGLAFGIVLVLMLIVVVIGANRFAHVQATTKQMVEKEWVKAEAANAINATTRAQARRTMELFLASDSAQRDKIYAHIEANKKIIVAALETLDKLIYLPKGKALLATIRTEREAYVASFTKVGKLIDAGDLDEAKRVMMGETLPTLDRLQTSVAELAELQKQIANAAAENVSKATTQGTNLLIGLGLGALVIAAVLALLITRSIVRPINNAVNIAKTIAGGDLTSTIDVRYSDETGQLLGALKEMNDSLLRVVSEVRAGTDTVSTASSQIAAGNLDLSSRTEEQASALEETAATMEETAATMEEITSTVKQNAEHARVANQLASSASSVASRGGEIVAEVVRTMDTIHQSSRKITDITGVIDGIAFQTNILALNAAVEAARAGEQGRGFAVVATEVRTLAQRASAAAREIKALIENSVEAVDTGCRLVEQAGSTMDEIVVSVRRVTDIMGEISGASDEQTTGISQVNEAVNQMDQVTQQNAALVEESAAVAASLEDKAAELARVVATFKLATDERPSGTQGNGPSGRIAQQVRRPSPLAGRRVPRLANAS